MYTKAVESMLNLLDPQATIVGWFRGKGWCCSRRHIDMCDQALEWNADLICLLGADQVLPEDILYRLQHTIEKGADAVAAQVPTRGYIEGNGLPPFGLQGWKLEDREYIPVTESGPIDAIGSGCFMFRAELLNKLQRPWFTEIIKDPETYTREGTVDSTFVRRLRTEANAHIVVDTTIPITHLHTFEIDHTFSDRFSDWAKPGVGDPDVCNFKEPK